MSAAYRCDFASRSRASRSSAHSFMFEMSCPARVVGNPRRLASAIAGAELRATVEVGLPVARYARVRPRPTRNDWPPRGHHRHENDRDRLVGDDADRGLRDGRGHRRHRRFCLRVVRQRGISVREVEWLVIKRDILPSTEAMADDLRLESHSLPQQPGVPRSWPMAISFGMCSTDTEASRAMRRKSGASGTANLPVTKTGLHTSSGKGRLPWRVHCRPMKSAGPCLSRTGPRTLDEP